MKRLSVVTETMCMALALFSATGAYALEPENALPEARELAEIRAARLVLKSIISKAQPEVRIVKSDFHLNSKVSPGTNALFNGEITIEGWTPAQVNVNTYLCRAQVFVELDYLRKRDPGVEFILEQRADGNQVIAVPRVKCEQTS